MFTKNLNWGDSVIQCYHRSCSNHTKTGEYYYSDGWVYFCEICYSKFLKSIDDLCKSINSAEMVCPICGGVTPLNFRIANTDEEDLRICVHCDCRHRVTCVNCKGHFPLKLQVIGVNNGCV